MENFNESRAWLDNRKDGFPSNQEFSDPFDDAMKEKMDIDKFLAKSLIDGNVEALQNMLKECDSARENRMLQYAVKSVDVDNKKLELSLSKEEDGSPVLEIESITINDKIACGGNRRSYTLTLGEDSASAVFNSSMGIKATHDKPVPVAEAVEDIQKNINKTLPR